MASELVGVNKNTDAQFYDRIRQVISLNLESPFMHVKWRLTKAISTVQKRQTWSWSRWENSCNGSFKKGGKVYTQIIPEAKSDTLLPIIRAKVRPENIVYTDTFRSYSALDVAEFKHYRINHSELFADKLNHINGIENFWNQAKRHMRKFNGIPRHKFNLFLKECEFCFNYGTPKELLKIIKKWIKIQNQM